MESRFHATLLLVLCGVFIANSDNVTNSNTESMNIKPDNNNFINQSTLISIQQTTNDTKIVPSPTELELLDYNNDNENASAKDTINANPNTNDALETCNFNLHEMIQSVKNNCSSLKNLNCFDGYYEMILLKINSMNKSSENISNMRELTSEFCTKNKDRLNDMSEADYTCLEPSINNLISCTSSFNKTDDISKMTFTELKNCYVTSLKPCVNAFSDIIPELFTELTKMKNGTTGNSASPIYANTLFPVIFISTVIMRVLYY